MLRRALLLMLCAVLVLAALDGPGRAEERSAEGAAADGPRVEVRLEANCGRTRGGVAIALPSGIIFYCPQRLAWINYRAPGAGDFFLAHEVGHIVLLSGDETAVDCWASRHFKTVPNGRDYVEAAALFIERFHRPSKKYGRPESRAANIRDCYDAPAISAQGAAQGAAQGDRARSSATPSPTGETAIK